MSHLRRLILRHLVLPVLLAATSSCATAPGCPVVLRSIALTGPITTGLATDATVRLAVEEYGPITRPRPATFQWTLEPPDAVPNASQSILDTVGATSPLVTLSSRGTSTTIAALPDVTWIALAAGRGRLTLTDAAHQQARVAVMAVSTGSDRLYPACID